MEHRNPEQAFDHAIKVGAMTTTPTADNFVGDYMYMYSDRYPIDAIVEVETADYFKHIDTRSYLAVVQS
jgi:uncharacterized glyoxalase superfamily protein PhnB